MDAITRSLCRNDLAWLADRIGDAHAITIGDVGDVVIRWRVPAGNLEQIGAVPGDVPQAHRSVRRPGDDAGLVAVHGCLVVRHGRADLLSRRRIPQAQTIQGPALESRSPKACWYRFLRRSGRLSRPYGAFL